MAGLSTIDFTIFCVTVIALVAIVYRKDEIAKKALSVVETATGLFGKILGTGNQDNPKQEDRFVHSKPSSANSKRVNKDKRKK